MVEVPETIEPAETLGHVHFVGIGGAGLSAIARVMLARGVTVSGSDAQESAVLDGLRTAGARCFVGHDPANLGDASTVIVSTAVRDTNPEVRAAIERGLRVWPRSAGLESVMRGRDVLAVAGTHGKTTTTSMLAMALREAGADPAYAVGAEVAGLGHNAADGGGDLFVAEADESDGAFLVYSPWGAVVTNVDADHLDFYGTPEAYRGAFGKFLDRIRPGGFLVACADDAGAASLVAEARERGIHAIGVGEGPDNDVRLSELEVGADGTRFELTSHDGPLGSVELRVQGRHYALDATAALVAGLECGYPFDRLAAGLAAYAGARRRMELIGEVSGVRVYDSYAHHPVEIAGDLDSARAIAGDGRLVVCFQPHLVSRTRIFGAEMGVALGAADEVVVTDIYLARDEPDPAVTSALITDNVGLDPAYVHHEADLARLPELLAGIARPGDVVLTLGAGDITTVAPLVVAALRPA